MAAAVNDSINELPSVPPGSLPPRMRVLFIAGACRTGGWLAEAVASDSASDVVLEETVGVAAGLARLRDDVFDAVLVSHEPEELDALELLEGLRAGSRDDQPIVVLGAQSEQEMAALCFEVGADSYVCVNTTTTRSLIWQVARAMERHQLIAENRRLLQAQRHRLQMEHDEAGRLLTQQRGLIDGLELIRGGDTTGGPPRPDATSPLDDRPLQMPDALVSHYQELLRAYVVMGSGNLTDEMNTLAEMLASVGVTAQQAMRLHLDVLEKMVQGLGSRSARHVMNRADLLVLEVMIKLAEDYRHRYLKRIHPPRQLLLPGIERAA